VTYQTKPIGLFLCGDVMTGRGIDQVLPHPGNPVLREPYVSDAREYVQLAESAHGPITRPVDFAYIWGDALTELARARPDVRIINLETSITSSEDYWPAKEVLYRMSPRNIGCLTAAGIDCCCLANNHVLDWGHKGLEETLQTLDAARIARTGAGRNVAEAESPAVLPLAPAASPDSPPPSEEEESRRVLVFSVGMTTSGIPQEWSASDVRPGVSLLRELSEDTARRVARCAHRFKRPGDVVVLSIHWGGNWGYDIPDEHIHFAHRLVEEGIDIVHGHSSHHVKTIEVYRNRPIFYGCGDFLTDYEGISKTQWFLSDLVLMYLAKMDPRQGRLVELRLVPFQSRGFRLAHASPADARWLCDRLNRLGAKFGTRVQLMRDNSLAVQWPSRELP
jgi:poly-gamma-glutamate capsule biosynthesis protein CapA/YwtB (metallophosphatase superfamily)